MTLDQIDQMVRQANPVPDLTVLEPVDASVLVIDQQRRTEMQTHNRVEVDQEQEKPRLGLLVGMAAAAAIVIGALVLLQPGDFAVAGDPIDVATAFVEAFGAFDSGKAASYLAADANLGGFGEDGEGMMADMRWREASGFKLLLDSCVATTTEPSGTSVRCAYDYHGIRSDEIGLGPYGGSWFDIRVQDGKIVSVSDNIQFMSNGFSSEMWEPFTRWITETYPENVAIMYDASKIMNQFTEASATLWEQRSREYVEIVGG
ncbi:MAG TPA: hypothetical protein VM848_06990 [Acidimicrobiia bacterium]|nr:hypothetical protein [Acidimicrobiia bacterium]